MIATILSLFPFIILCRFLHQHFLTIPSSFFSCIFSIIFFFFSGIWLKHFCEKMPFSFYFTFAQNALSLSLSPFISSCCIIFLSSFRCIGGSHPVICLRISLATTFICFSFLFPCFTFTAISSRLLSNQVKLDHGFRTVSYFLSSSDSLQQTTHKHQAMCTILFNSHTHTHTHTLSLFNTFPSPISLVSNSSPSMLFPPHSLYLLFPSSPLAVVSPSLCSYI